MDESISNSIIILHSILRLGITVFCVTRAKYKLRSQFWWGVFGLFLPLLALIWIILLKPKKSNEKPNSIKSHQEDTRPSDIAILKNEEDRNIQLLKELELKVDELQKLKLHNLLTKEEFLQKNEIVLKRKEAIVQELDKIELEQELGKVKSLVNDQIKPQLLLLESTFNSELLTQVEYESKRNQLFNDRYNSIFRMLTLDSSFKFNMQVKNENSLAKIHRIEINKIIPKARIGEVMLINNFLNDLNKYSYDKFIEINNSDFSSKYSYINIPNLLDRLGYPQLQKKFKNESSVE